MDSLTLGLAGVPVVEKAALRPDAQHTSELAYLTSLKTGAESGQFAAYPRGEISRWS